MIVCPQCGKSFPEDEAFCASCGYAASKVEPPTTNDATNPYAVGTQLPDSPMPSDVEPRDVPSGMVAALKMCFKERNLKNRSSRAEFWFLIAWNILTVVLPFFLILELLFGGYPNPDEWSIVWIPLIWGFVLAIPTFGVTIRRFHDVNLPGISAYAFLALLGLGLIVDYLAEEIFGFYDGIFILGCCLLICLFTILIVALIPGMKGPNRYGPPPVKRKTTAKDKTQNDEVAQ